MTQKETPKPIAKILQEFNRHHSDFVGRSRYIHIGGGLGDVFNHLYWMSCYADLETLGPSERVFVLLSSHNSCAWELFGWHRNADRITVADVGMLNFLYSELERDHKRAENLGMMRECDPHRWPIPGPVVFYPPPGDLDRVKEIRSGGKYAVFALAASCVTRSISKQIGESAALLCLRTGLRVVLTGRNYALNEGGTKRVRRQEIRIYPWDGVVDLIDVLTVPGTAQIVEGAAAVFTCHSSICTLAWHMRRPTFVLYDQAAKELYFTKKFEGFSFGAAFSENAHATFSEYTDEKFVEFLEKAAAHGKRSG